MKDVYDALKVFERFKSERNNHTLNFEDIDFHCQRSFDKLGYNTIFDLNLIDVIGYSFEDATKCESQVCTQHYAFKLNIFNIPFPDH